MSTYFTSGTMIVAKNIMRKKPDLDVAIKTNIFLDLKEETQMFPDLEIILKAMYIDILYLSD